MQTVRDLLYLGAESERTGSIDVNAIARMLSDLAEMFPDEAAKMRRAVQGAAAQESES